MTFDPATFHGIVPPVITPLNERFEVDYPSLTKVIEHLIVGGVHGLFVLGSTGEVVFHDAATRRKILDHAVKIVNGRVPLLAGAVDPTTDRVISHGRAAAAAGVDALVVTAPFYTRTSQAETLDHFRYVRDGVALPVIAYDIPVLSTSSSSAQRSLRWRARGQSWVSRIRAAATARFAWY